MKTYLKAPVKKPREKPGKKVGFFSLLFLGLGLFLMFQAALPVIGWYLFSLPGIGDKIISPLWARAEESYEPTTWFINASKSTMTAAAGLKTYNLSIPKLKIDKAVVNVGGDLKKSLVAWPTSAMPGGWGNNIIFGHSELPQFANPKDYSGIFTHLMELKEGEEIILDYDGVRYVYKMIDQKVVEPTDISVLEQRFDSSYITLITCVPPGTLWKRGVVRGKIVKF